MEFSKFIEENQGLLEYFTRFPKQLMVLAAQVRHARIDIIRICRDFHVFS